MSYISTPPIKINPPHHGWIGGWRQRGGVGSEYWLLMIASRLLQKTCQLWLKSCAPVRLTSLVSARTLNHSELFRWDFEKNVWKHTHADEINICGVDVVRGLKIDIWDEVAQKKTRKKFNSSLIDRKTIEDGLRGWFAKDSHRTGEWITKRREQTIIWSIAGNMTNGRRRKYLQ